jgi:class 3 adenylate cyclase/tetratricopeptide (TPR) repeat protein
MVEHPETASKPMSHDRSGQLYRPYLPRWIQERVSAATLRAGNVHSSIAVVLYADLSGFTRLTAAFAALPDGAEQLHDVLNRLYGAMIDTVVAHNGDIAAIAGDALTAWWPDTDDASIAERCALALQATLAALPAVITLEGVFQLDLRIGISVGPVYVALVGLPSYGVHPVLFGPAIAAAVGAEREAAPGAIHRAVPMTEASVLPAVAGEGPVLTWEHFLPPTLGVRLRLSDLGAEYRRCVPAFCAFDLPERPDDLHRLIVQVQAVVLRWGGWLNEVEVGDKGAVLVLLFGAPVARGDDASRAVGCCLELHSRGLIERAGISVGTLFLGAVGSPIRRVYTAQGDDMNLAAHLMQIARPSALLVSSYVRQEILGRYRTSAPRLISPKGHTDGVPVAEIIIAPPGAPSNASLQRYLGADGKLIGRDDEVQRITAAVEAAAQGRRTLLLIEGESGIGKTSLIQHLVQLWNAKGLPGFAGECSSGGQTTPLLAWRPILLDLCGIDESASPAQRRAVFEQAVSRLDTSAPNQGALAHLLGLTEAQPELPEVEPVALAAALIAARLQTGPVLIVLEDMQWADAATLRLALLLLTTTPPEQPWPLCLVLAHRPLDGPNQSDLAALQAHAAAQRILLGALNPTASAELSRSLLNVAYISADLAQHVARHAEGQPLFIREYLRALRHHDLISISDGTARLKQAAPTVQLANSAQGVIQARVDRLDEQTRLTLKIAAVIGRSFPFHLLAAVHPTSPGEALLRAQLDELRERQIIELELGDPEPVYRFKHGITHEVAYTSLLFGRRRQLHAAVARWYQTIHAEAIATNRAPLAVYDVLIGHLRCAEEWEPTIQAGRAAALCALAQHSTMAALRYIDQALVFATATATRSDLLMLLLTIHERTGNLGSQAPALIELEQLVDQTSEPFAQLYTRMLRLQYLLTIGAFEAAITQAQQLNRRINVFRQIPGVHRQHLDLVRASVIDARGTVRAAQGKLATAHRLHQAALHVCQTTPITGSADATFLDLFDRRVLTMRCLDHLGSVRLRQGDPTTALTYHRQALQLAQTWGDWPAETRARQGLAAVYLAQGDAAAAYAQAISGLTTSHAVADRAGQALSLRQLAAISAARGDHAEAQRQVWHALAICTSTRAQALERELLHTIAAYATAQGQHEEAAAARHEATRERGI